MKFNLKERCHDSRKKEFFYGAKINPDIQDAYLGLCYLDPNERKRKIGPGRGHEEILLIINGKAEIIFKKEENLQLEEGEVYHIPNGKKLRLNNLTNEKVYFVIAGGHTKHHHHHH
jgi:mannose-6-phosphate isomerase class I